MPDLFEIIHREWPVIKAAPYAVFISVVVIISIVWFVFERMYRKKLEAIESAQHSTTSTSSVSDSGNVRDSGNSTIRDSGNSNVNFHFPESWGPRPLDATPPKIAEKREPQLTCAAIRPARLADARMPDRLVSAGSGPDNSIVAVIANDAVKGAGEANGVAAQIVFRDGPNEIARGFGTWVGGYSPYVNFNPGQPHELILARTGPLAADAVFNPRDPEPTWTSGSARTRWLLRGHRQLQYKPLTESPLQVEVSVIDSDGAPLFNLSLQYERSESGEVKFTQL